MARKPAQVADPAAENLHRQCCGNCTCWERYPDTGQTPGCDIAGDCLLHPPRVIDVDDETGATLQGVPQTFFRDRCGQHRPQVN